MKPNIKPHGLNIGEICEFPPQKGGGALWAMGERQFDKLEGLEPTICEGG